MKNDDLFILVIIIFTFFVDFDKGFTPVITNVVANDKYELIASEAMIAYQDLDNPFSEEERIIPNEICSCDGKKYLVHGDGNKTKCPCENCKCTKTSSEKPEVGILPEFSETKTVKYQLIKLSAKWCGPCQNWEGVTDKPNIFNEASPGRVLKRGGWGVDENKESFLLSIDVDKCPDEYKRFLKNKDGTSRNLPYFIMTVNGEEVESLEGYQEHKTLTDMFYRYFK